MSNPNFTMKPVAKPFSWHWSKNRTIALSPPQVGGAVTALRKYGLIERNEAGLWDLTGEGWNFYEANKHSLAISTCATFQGREEPKSEPVVEATDNPEHVAFGGTYIVNAAPAVEPEVVETPVVSDNGIVAATVKSEPKPQHNAKVQGYVNAIRADLGLESFTDHDIASVVWRSAKVEGALKYARSVFVDHKIPGKANPGSEWTQAARQAVGA